MLYAESFIFDGISSEQFGLMIYTFDGSGQSDVDMPSVGEIVNGWIPQRYSDIRYGLAINEPLSFEFTFGLTPVEANSGRRLDRWDVQKISGWLTGHRTYKYLTFEQPDLKDIRFKAQFTRLMPITFNGEVIAFEAKVTCDSAFGYLMPETYEYSGADTSGNIHNPSGWNGNYYPNITIAVDGGGAISIENETNDTGIYFTGLPSGEYTITIDGLNKVIMSSSGINMYQYLDGFTFFALGRGDNSVVTSGNASVSISCEFPVSTGV